MSILGDLSRSQRRVIAVGAVILGAMFLFPPFHFINYRGVQLNLGYAWLFSPPLVDDRYAGSVNIALLLVQWLAVGVVCAIALLLLRTPRNLSACAQSVQVDQIIVPKSNATTSSSRFPWWAMVVFFLANSFLAEIIGNRYAFSRVPQYPELLITDFASGLGRFLIPLILVAATLFVVAKARHVPFPRRGFVVMTTILNVVLNFVARQLQASG